LGDDKPTPQSEFVPRIGTFLIILGIFSFIFFLASDLADLPDFDWLFTSLILFGIGYLFRRRAAPPPSAGRFGTVRRMREDAKKRKEERAKKAKK
jgi:hypothetical protein